MLMMQVQNNKIRNLINEKNQIEVEKLLTKKPYYEFPSETASKIKLWYYISKDANGCASLKWTLTEQEAIDGDIKASRAGRGLINVSVGSVETYVGSLLHKQALKFRV